MDPHLSSLRQRPAPDPWPSAPTRFKHLLTKQFFFPQGGKKVFAGVLSIQPAGWAGETAPDGKVKAKPINAIDLDATAYVTNVGVGFWDNKTKLRHVQFK